MKISKIYKSIIEVLILAAIVLLSRMLVEKILPMFYERFGLFFSDFMFQTLSNYPITIGMIVLDVLLVMLLNKRIPYGVNAMIRTLLEISGIILISIVASLILRSEQFFWKHSGGIFFDRLFLFTFVSFTLFDVLVVALVDILYYYRWTNKKALNAEVEKRAKANYQYQLLKSEMNPHFLFNCLNVLEYLIYIDKDRASDYVKKLAGVYRYFLKMENLPYVMLEEEINFVRQYVDLLDERFGPGLDIKMDIPPEAMEKKIVSCTMQMMIENAVKHNVANKNRILHIEFAVHGKYLIASNNIQIKKQIEKGMEIGLKNIQQQYNILFKESIIVNNDGKSFQVKIPLID